MWLIAVYLSTKNGVRAEELMRHVSNLVDSVVINELSVGCKGPLLGMVTAAMKVICDFILTVSGDVSKILPWPLREFVDRCLEALPDSVSIVWGNGIVDPLIQLQSKAHISSALPQICSIRAGIAKPSDILRSASKLLVVNSKNVTSDPTIFTNINTREDLIALKPRGPFKVDVSDYVLLKLEVKRNDAPDSLFRRPFKASKFYEKEVAIYSEKMINHIAACCLANASYKKS